MSNNISVDEIIRQAEKIKQDAQKHLEEMQKHLEKQAETAIDQVTVDAKDVLPKVDNTQKDDVKTFRPSRFANEKNDFKTKVVTINKDDDNTKVISFKRPDKTTQFSKVSTDKTQPINEIKNVEYSIRSEGRSKQKKRLSIISTNPQTIDEKSDIKEIPTIVAFDDKMKRNLGFESFDSDLTEEIGEQIRFDGFDDEIDSVDKIDEQVAEKILKERRKEKVGKFRLFGPDETDKNLQQNKVVKDDYVNDDEKTTILERLFKDKGRIQGQFIATVILGIIALILTILKDTAYLPSFLTTYESYIVATIVLYVLSIVVNLNIVIHGFNFKNGINYDLPIALSAIVVLIHTILFVLDKNFWYEYGALLPLAMNFAFSMSELGKLELMRRIINNFEFISSSKNRYTLENIVNSVDAHIISRGIIEDEPELKVSVKTDFPTNFLEISCKNEPADRISKRLGIISVILNAILLVVLGFMFNWYIAINVTVCGLIIALPVMSLYLTNSIAMGTSKALKTKGSRVCGFEGAKMANEANAIVMEAQDLFGLKGCDLRGIKTLNGAKADDAILYTASVMIKTKSPLAHVFDEVIIGQQSILPDVEDIVYEEKMGTSAWIYDKKVLVGNRDLLVRHGVPVQREGFEEKYIKKGRKPLYLAVDGKVWAIFLVSYSADPELKRELRKLEKSGITIILKSCDPYINDESISQLFNVPMGFIRVMNSSSSRVFDKYSDLHVEKSPAYVVHDGTALGFISSVRGAVTLTDSKKTLSFLSYFGSAIGFASVVLLAFIDGYSQLNAVNIVGFQVLWGAFMWLVSKIKRIGL